jgi:hypothetical protein
MAKRRKKIGRKGRQAFVLRLPADVNKGLTAMAAEAGISKNALVVLMLRQAVAWHKAEAENPGLFEPTHQMVERLISRAVGEPKR